MKKLKKLLQLLLSTELLKKFIYVLVIILLLLLIINIMDGNIDIRVHDNYIPSSASSYYK
jgi:hypothetical protein